MNPSIVYSSPFRFFGNSHPERSTRVADLSLGTAHVEGSDETTSRLSTESLEVIFTAPPLPFPFFLEFWLFLTDIDDAVTSGESEHDPKVQI